MIKEVQEKEQEKTNENEVRYQVETARSQDQIKHNIKKKEVSEEE